MKALAVVGLTMVTVLAMAWVFQRRLIYFPDTGAPSVPAGFEEVSYVTGDGLEESGWFLWAPASRATVVLFSGNAGNRAARVPLAMGLADRGFSTLLVDYRGYGGNPGSPTEEGLTADAVAALEYLSNRPDVDPDRLVYFGESLGAGVAISLARTHRPAALVLRSPFTSLGEIAAHHYPWLPVSVLLRDRYPSIDTIVDLEVPLLVVAGSEDTIVPTDQSVALFEESDAPKELVVIDGANHNDFALLAGDRLLDAVEVFVADVLR